MCEEREAVRHVTTHVLLGLELPADQRIELPVRVGVHLHRHGGDPGVGDLELVEFPKIEGRLAGRSLGHPARCPHIALVVSVHELPDAHEAVFPGRMKRQVHVGGWPVDVAWVRRAVAGEPRL